MIDHLDHLVLTTSHEALCVDFYTRVLGMKLERFVSGNPPVERKAFIFGNQKINLHISGREFEPKASIPTPFPWYCENVELTPGTQISSEGNQPS